MIAYISDNKTIQLDQVTQGAEESLVTYFSVKHPKAYFLDTDSDWDGWFRKYKVSKQTLALPLLTELINCCSKSGIPLEIIDQRDVPKFPAPQPDQITDTLLDGITLEDHQTRSLKVACGKEIGIFDMTTGAGKTEVMCGLIKMFRCPTLVVTEQTVVLDQIVDRLRLRNVVHNDDIAKFCHGEMPNGNLVMVGSIQSLNTPSSPKRKPKQCTTAQARREGKRLAKVDVSELNEDDSSLPLDLRQLPSRLPANLRKALQENPKGIDKLEGKYLDILIEFPCVSFNFLNIKIHLTNRLKQINLVYQQYFRLRKNRRILRRLIISFRN